MKDLETQVFEYLDWLRETGKTNMFGATPYILSEYDFLDEDEAREYLNKWMETFSMRHSR